MPTALVFSPSAHRCDAWTHSLEEDGWHVLPTRRLLDVFKAGRLGADVAIVDVETPRELRELLGFYWIADRLPMLIRTSALSACRTVAGSWRGILHRGELGDVCLRRTAAMLLNATSAESTRIPVSLPVLPVTKWSVRLA